MRRWVLLALVLVVAFLYVKRDLLFVRDPLGSVTREGAPEKGAQVYVNLHNDVLLENDNPPMYLNVLLHGQPVSAPATLKCIHFVACLLSGDDLAQTLVIPGARVQSMTPEQVRYVDADGRAVVVTLR